MRTLDALTVRSAIIALGSATLLLGTSCADSGDPQPSPPTAAAPVAGYEVVADYPHDPGAYTQGLLYLDGVLYESTGEYGSSTVRRVDLETGTVLAVHRLSDAYFGEGLTHFDRRLYQLTWREGRGFLYDPDTLAPVGLFAYPSREGWGLAQDGESLILSDGSSTLYFLDPDDQAERRRITVTDAGHEVIGLNELEYIEGEIWANLWRSDRIARIDPASGQVRSWVDLAGLLPEGICSGPVGVLNGIAYDAAGDRILVTGKDWCRLYQIRVIDPS